MRWVSFGFGDDIGAGGERDAWGFWRLWMYVCMYVVRRLGGEKLVSTVGSLGCHNHLKNGKLFTSGLDIRFVLGVSRRVSPSTYIR